MSENSQPEARVRSALFAPVQIAEATGDDNVISGDQPEIEAPAAAPRRRKMGRAKKAAAGCTLQVRCDKATWIAVRYEALNRQTNVTNVILRALRSHYPSVNAASREAA